MLGPGCRERFDKMNILPFFGGGYKKYIYIQLYSYHYSKYTREVIIKFHCCCHFGCNAVEHSFVFENII